MKRAAASQYRPKAGVRAATAAALSAAEDNLPRQTFFSRATRVLGCHQWKGLALGATAEDVPFSSGRFLARPSTGALPSGEQYAASLERFAGGRLSTITTNAPVGILTELPVHMRPSSLEGRCCSSSIGATQGARVLRRGNATSSNDVCSCAAGCCAAHCSRHRQVDSALGSSVRTVLHM